MIINIVTPGSSGSTFTGGMWCLMEYAHGLAARGHTVNVVPIFPCSGPEEWFLRPIGNWAVSSLCGRVKESGRALLGCIAASIEVARNKSGKHKIAVNARELVDRALLLLWPRMIPENLATAVSASYLKSVLPAADVTLATASGTALPVKLFGQGRLFYFMQHFEPLFAVDNADPYVAGTQAVLTYHLGLEMIANSSWLKKRVEGEVAGAQVRLCMNAIDHNVFFGEPRLTNHPDEVTVISYSGGGRPWKGFREMVEAVAIARKSLPGVTIRWQVYGPAGLLPPQNPLAPYEPLGFLQHPDLAQACRKADVLLGASWYESFPLFPLEAMACGLAVITTPEGTEDYAIHEQTAEIVCPKDPESIARGLIRVLRDTGYRFKIAKKGNEISRNFTWENSVSTMEDILSKGQTGASSVSKDVLAAPTYA